MFSCCEAKKNNELILPEVFLEYRHKDPESKRLMKKQIRYESSKDDKQFHNWKKMKFRGKDKQKILKSLNDDSFVDIQFPHTIESISNQDPIEPIEWKRVKDVVELPSFVTSETIANFPKLAIPNKLLKEALLFIYKTSLQKFKELLSQDYCEEGIYEFKLYNKGVIENYVIDDYIPVIGNSPFMAPPINEKQIFLIMIEKVLAKACGSYQNIPDNLEVLLEMLFCGPIRKTKILELTDYKKVEETIFNTMESKGVTGFFTKADPKIRNFGLQQNQLYIVIELHKVEVEGLGMVTLIQMQGTRKFASWNGKFAHNDEIWQKVPNQKRHYLFKKLKDNKSFVILMTDIVRIFDNLLAFEGTQSRNKDWIEATSEREYPSYSTFEVEQEDNVLIHVQTEQKLQGNLIVSKLIQKNEYEFVGGVFSPNENIFEVMINLTPGKYIICVNHDWNYSNSGRYVIFLSSNTHVKLDKSAENSFSNLLEIMFKKHALEFNKHPETNPNFTSKKFYSICNLVSETGYMYMYIDIIEKKKDKIMIKIDPKILNQEKWEVLEPHKNRELIEIEKNGREEVLIILKNLAFNTDQKRFFPSAAFKIIQ